MDFGNGLRIPKADPVNPENPDNPVNSLSRLCDEGVGARTVPASAPSFPVVQVAHT